MSEKHTVRGATMISSVKSVKTIYRQKRREDLATSIDQIHVKNILKYMNDEDLKYCTCGLIVDTLLHKMDKLDRKENGCSALSVGLPMGKLFRLLGFLCQNYSGHVLNEKCHLTDKNNS
ncbi:hypothetical protein NPIL_159241 [Nephila pilipes]|uniref:Uncharacterized protein n=1 Tax=Nephila pilipes TaxID=299642 RepID=A0A8X6QHI2_NEPPI|nr:hypothetical protein NPIL_159241 [Nephila pilipes]